MGKVFFIGIGPGDPELLTLRALKLIREAHLIVYPGSLISEAMLNFIQKENPTAEYYNAFGKSLSEILIKMEEYLVNKQIVARLVSGDPSIYSSIMEHIERLREKNYAYEIIPGISSALLASAKLGIEFTYPELSHSVIFTRLEGKTGGPKNEEIKYFAKSKSTLVFFLSAGLKDKLTTLLKEIYPDNTKIAILYKLSHPEEKIILTTIKDLAETMDKYEIKKTALIVVGDVLNLIDKNFNKRSILYGER
ncbi:MAG: cobalt-precorrin-4/precorrin-4 C(11)-methyltransferase [Caldimicrobium sp.]